MFVFQCGGFGGSVGAAGAEGEEGTSFETAPSISMAFSEPSFDFCISYVDSTIVMGSEAGSESGVGFRGAGDSAIIYSGGSGLEQACNIMFLFKICDGYRSTDVCRSLHGAEFDGIHGGAFAPRGPLTRLSGICRPRGFFPRIQTPKCPLRSFCRFG
jgi:hypothetical protein